MVVLFNKFNTLLILVVLWQAWRIDNLEKLVNMRIDRDEETYAKIYAAMDRLQERTEAKADRLCDRLSEVEDDTRKLKRQNNFYDDSDRYKYDWYYKNVPKLPKLLKTLTTYSLKLVMPPS